MDQNIIIRKAIWNINNSASYSITGTDLSSIIWENGTTAIPVTDIEAQIPAVTTEFQWKELRDKRNKLLIETDYLANSDVTMSDEMQTYRQALRDLPANTSDPANPTWPTKPGG